MPSRMTRNQLRKRLVRIESYNFTASNVKTGEVNSIKALQRDLAYVTKAVLLLERKMSLEGIGVTTEELEADEGPVTSNR